MQGERRFFPEYIGRKSEQEIIVCRLIGYESKLRAEFVHLEIM